jgi:thiamine biosynthesis lipoprotein
MARKRDDRHTLAHEAMATQFRLTVVHADAVYARQAAAAAFEELDRIEGRLSRFVEPSDISRVNRLGRGQSTVVQPDTLDCLGIAMEVRRDTQGAFDVAYASAGPRPRGLLFELNAEDHTVRVLADGVVLDLGGIGKGFALDRMAGLLADWEIDRAVLAASTSTLLALGAPLRESGWLITFGPEHDLRREQLVNRALSGSGTAVKGDHIIDPRTAYPVQNRLRAWAGAPSAALADALSTAFMVMTQAEIRGYCERHPEVSAHVLECGDSAPLYWECSRPSSHCERPKSGDESPHSKRA